jgi:hypothetical protein
MAFFHFLEGRSLIFLPRHATRACRSLTFSVLVPVLVVGPESIH